MSSNAFLMGMVPMPGRTWPDELIISGVEAPNEAWEVDPTLPTLGQDPRVPNSDLIVIPRGRILGLVTYAYSSASGAAGFRKTRLTLADGYNNYPIGFSNNNILKQFPSAPQSPPVAHRMRVVSFPYTPAVNGAHGNLSVGDRVMPFWGSATSATKTPSYVGRPVKWVPEVVYNTPLDNSTGTYALSGNAFYNQGGLTSHVYGIRPKVICAFTSGGVILGVSGADALTNSDLTWTSPWWTVASSNFYNYLGAIQTANITSILASYGASSQQACGEVLGLEIVNTTNKHEFPGWLKWVQDQFIDSGEQLRTLPVPYTAVTAEQKTMSAVNGGYCTLTYKPVIAWKDITVTITGSYQVTDPNTGEVTTTSVTGEALPKSNDTGGDQTTNAYYGIDEKTGRLDLFSSVTLDGVTALSVAYNYETSYADGPLMSSGQLGMTDGQYTGIPGTPRHLEAYCSVGQLRVMLW